MAGKARNGETEVFNPCGVVPLPSLSATRRNDINMAKERVMSIVLNPIRREVHEFRPLNAEQVQNLLESRWAPVGVRLPDEQLLPEVIASLIRMDRR